MAEHAARAELQRPACSCFTINPGPAAPWQLQLQLTFNCKLQFNSVSCDSNIDLQMYACADGTMRQR